MKNKALIYGLMLAMSMPVFTSCNDFLDTPPRSTQTVDQFYTNEAEAQMGVNGLYNWLGSRFGYYGYGEASAFMLEYPTGQAVYTVGQQSLMNPDFEKLVYWDRGYVDSWWQSCYYGIQACNMFLKGVERLPQTDAVNQMIGEAYFLRAYYYFNLVRIFGDIPLKLTATENPSDGLIAKASVKDIYDKAILPDLEQASQCKITNKPSSGRVSMEAVNALYAQVYMAMAGYPLNETDKYALARAKAEQVVDSPNLALFQSEGSITWFEKFRSMGYDNQGEYILMANFGNSPAPMQNYSQFLISTEAPSLTGFVGFGSLMPTEEFINSYEDGDLRAQEKGFFFTSYQSADGSAVLNFEPSIYKFFEPSLQGSGGVCGKSLPLIRYADILLTYAEAAARSGQITEKAVVAINSIRERAGLSDLSSNIVNNVELFIDAVMKERVHELCYENVAYFDMQRTHKAWDSVKKEFVDLNGFVLPSGAVYDVSKHFYFPIPLREKQINPNL